MCKHPAFCNQRTTKTEKNLAVLTGTSDPQNPFAFFFLCVYCLLFFSSHYRHMHGVLLDVHDKVMMQFKEEKNEPDVIPLKYLLEATHTKLDNKCMKKFVCHRCHQTCGHNIFKNVIC